MKYWHWYFTDISIGGQVKEETEKSTRQRTRVARVDGKPSTINPKRRLDRSPTRRGRIVKPATKGTEIPYEARPSPSTINTHTTMTKTYPNHNHENIKNTKPNFFRVLDIYQIISFGLWDLRRSYNKIDSMGALKYWRNLNVPTTHEVRLNTFLFLRYTLDLNM